MKKISIICLLGGTSVSILYAYLTVNFLSAHKLLNESIPEITEFVFGYMLLFYLSVPLFVYISASNAHLAIATRSKTGKEDYLKYIADYPTKLGYFLLRHPIISAFFALAPLCYLLPFLAALFANFLAFLWEEISMSISDKWEDIRWKIFRR